MYRTYIIRRWEGARSNVGPRQYNGVSRRRRVRATRKSKGDKVAGSTIAPISILKPVEVIDTQRGTQEQQQQKTDRLSGPGPQNSLLKAEGLPSRVLCYTFRLNLRSATYCLTQNFDFLNLEAYYRTLCKRKADKVCECAEREPCRFINVAECKNPSCYTLAVEPRDQKGTVSVCLVSRQCVATYTLLTVAHVHLARDPDTETKEQIRMRLATAIVAPWLVCLDVVEK